MLIDTSVSLTWNRLQKQLDRSGIKKIDYLVLTHAHVDHAANACQAVVSLPVQDQPTIHQFIARLTEAEIQHRVQLKPQVYPKVSKLRYNAVMEQVYCNATQNLTQDHLMKIADCNFIERSENILITGAMGCGKSYLACAIGRQACSFGYKTLYVGMTRFLERISRLSWMEPTSNCSTRWKKHTC